MAGTEMEQDMKEITTTTTTTMLKNTLFTTDVSKARFFWGGLDEAKS